jgi:branched-chain amino acid aminotransferase
LLADFHFERLFSSLDTLKFSLPKVFTAQKLAEQIVEVANKNNHQQHARIRLTCYRGNGGLYDDVSDMPNYLIQSWALADNIIN